jgi:phospholipase/carboxylesterase
MSSLQNTLSPLQQSTDFELAFRIKQPQPAQPKACVILLHGVGGSETNLTDLAAGIGPYTLVVLPRGPLEFAPGQFGWFRVAFTASGPRIVESEAEQSRLALIRFVEQLQSAYSIAPQHPERVAAFGVLSGRILPELQPYLADKQRLATLRAFIGHGEYDSKLPAVWAQRSGQLLTELGVEHLTRLYPIDHSISLAMQVEFLEWFQKLG